MQKTHHRLLALLMALVMVFQFAVITPGVAFAETTEASVSAEESSSTDGQKSGESLRATNSSILAFTSDTHNKDGNQAAQRLGTWLDKMASIYGKKVDVMAFGGDMANASASESAFWTLTQADMDQLSSRNVTGVYTTGNHEYSPGSYTNGKNSTTQKYVENQEGINGSNYRIYCLGSSAYAESGSGGGSWWGGGGWNEYTDSQVTKLTNYLNGIDNSKVVIVITHYPLHYTSSRTITGASNVIDALNAAANSGKKIIYLWGHNHTDAPRTETNYDKVFKPGDSITYNNGQSKTIQFYYGAAGCMSDSEYGTGSGSVKGKGLIVEINDENKLTMTYYDANGNDVTDGGSYTEADPVAATGITVGLETQSQFSGSGSEADPFLLENGRSLQLSVTFEPENANTGKTVSWSSSDTAVATVDQNGKVKGISEGIVTITAKLETGKKAETTSSVVIQIMPRSTSEPMYVLTDSLEVGKNYIIANANNGQAFALTNNNGSVSKTSVEVDGDVIYTDNESIVFTANGSGSTVTSLENNGRFVQAANGSLSLPASAPSDVTFDYGSDNKLTARSGNTTYYIYYSTYNNGNFSGSTSASSSTSPREVYLFEEVTEQISVTEVAVAPSEATVEARKYIQLTATVAPENATNKKVTWSSNKASVATVDDNGKVRGVAEGTAVITATTADGGKTASATIHVTPSTSTEQHYVIVIDGYALSVDRSPNTAQGGSSSYTYTGLAGVEYASGTVADDSIRWIIEETEGGYYIKSLDGRYLNATYTSGNNSGQGNLKLDETPDVWVLDSGYSFSDGTVDGSKLKSSNASATATSDKFLGYEESPANLFTARSNDNADTVTIEEAVDPIAVTGVSVSPITVTIKTQTTTQLTAHVVPENATNKNVTWSSSDNTVARVDTNGVVRGISVGVAEITVTTADGGKTAKATVTVEENENPQTGYIITIGNYAMSTEASDDQLENTGSSTQQRFYYTGLAGVAYTADGVTPDNIWWNIEETDGGIYIMSPDGRYLNATYESNSTGGSTGTLKLDNVRDVWVLDGTIEDWMIDGSMLKSTNSTKYLAEETGKNNTHFFTVRSEANADETHVTDPSVTIEERFVETNTLENGKEYIIAVTKDNGSVYAIKNVSGTGTGNTGSVVLNVVPGSGSDAAYIETDDEDVVWTYASSNQYMSTSNSHYLGYESSTYLPRTSSQGRAIIYSGGKLQISSGRYLSCSNGTFSTVTSSSGGSEVRLFAKTVVIVECEHVYGAPTAWSWTGSDATGYSAATATFVCSKCGDVKTVSATVTGPENGKYTAAAVGPDGNTYYDYKNVTVSDSFYVKIHTDTQYAYAGQEVEFKIALGPNQSLSSMEMQLLIPDGWDYVENSLQVIVDPEEIGFKFLDKTEGYKMIDGNTEEEDAIISEETDIATFKCVVNSTGTVTFNKEGRWEFYTDTTTDITDKYEAIPATVTVKDLTVTWKDGDGNTLKTEQVAYGTTPEYTGETPTKTSTAQYTYTFNNTWSPEIAPMTEAVTYTAQFDSTVNKYRVTFVDEDETTVLKAATEYEYGTPAASIVKPADPTKESTAQYTFTFAGWTPTIADVTGDVIYKATYTSAARKYTVTWKNWDGNVLEIDENVAYGVTPVYNGETPVKPDNDGYTYSFTGWDPQISAVEGDITYTAVFDSGTVQRFTIRFVNEDGTLLQSSEVAYGTIPSYTGVTPSKEATAQYSFTFAGWDPELTEVTGEATYKAIYNKTVNKYTIRFVNDDGTVLQSSEVEYGTTPVYEGDTPEKESTAQYSYTFNGWDHAIVAVTEGATYTATYKSAIRKYTINFVNDDETVLLSTEVAYGDTPVYTGTTPAKESTAQYTYTFAGWDHAIVAVTGEATYKATYTAVANKYTVIWKNWDGDILETDENIVYGSMPVYNGETPVKPENAGYTYTFVGWNPEISSVTGDVTYTAVFDDGTLQKFTVKFVNEDNTLLQSSEVAFGVIPAYNGETPTKESTTQYSYTFKGWAPEIVAVTGDATYTAVYERTVNKYTIRFVNESGTVLQSSEVEYGTTPVYAGETPKKESTAQYSYTFKAWTPEVVAVTGEATYTAVFTETLNKYIVTFLDEDGETVFRSTVVDYGTAWADVDKPEPTRSGYVLDGWSNAPDKITGDVAVTAKWKLAVSYVMSTNLNLNGKLAYKANVVLTDEVLADENAYMLITYTTAPTPEDAEEVTKKYYVKDAEISPSNGIDRRVFVVPFFIAQLNDRITMKLYSSKGELLPFGKLEDEQIVDMTTTGFVDTAWAYCNKAIASPKTSSTMKELAKQLKIYGTAAQLYFNYHTDLIPEGAVEALNEAVAGDSIATALASYTEKISGTKPDGIDRYTKLIVCEADHSLKYIFYLKKGADISKYKFEIWDEEAKDGKGDYVEVTPVKMADAKYSIQKENIASGLLSHEYKFKVTCDGQSFEITSSGRVYMSDVLRKSSNTAMLNLAKSMYLYSEAAEKQFGVSH